VIGINEEGPKKEPVDRIQWAGDEDEQPCGPDRADPPNEMTTKIPLLKGN
jgi:hypothetical protein